MNSISDDQVKLESSWKQVLKDEFQAPYMKKLKAFLTAEYSAKKQIFPRCDQYFAALNSTPFNKVKVVILGQEPYHGVGQAHGLSFSVPPLVAPPPSLVNIFKELNSDLGLKIPRHGYLQSWAAQGVLLLNSVLTVAQSSPESHQNQGWEVFTDHIIAHLSQEREHLVFLLWGAYAQRKGVIIDRNRHLVLEAPHPSPFSARRGFFGCRHFSLANEYLIRQGEKPIAWQLPEEPH